MAQLKDDCFAFGGDLMPLADALAQLQGRVAAVAKTEVVTLRQCLGRILAEDIVAGVNVPPHDNSAVDGFAVYFDDLDADADTRLPVGGRIAAGHPLDGPADRGHAYQIFTGAPMPVGDDGTQNSGPDTIFMEEDCSVDGDAVILPAGLKKGSNRRFKAEDVAAGATIITVGKRLRAQEIGLAASTGRAQLTVFKRLRVAVFSTGDEVRDPGHGREGGEAPDGCIYDANRYAIMALLEGLGADVTDLGILQDDVGVIAKALEAAQADHDLLVTSGGVSAGEEDHVRDAVASLGQIHFWRLAIKPGRPIALGHVGGHVGGQAGGQAGGEAGGTAFLGLPGNPVAAMVTFMIIGRPLVLLLSGATESGGQRYPVVAGFDYTKKKGRREWARVKLKINGEGLPVAMKHHSSGAGILTSMVDADGLIELPEDTETMKKGAMVDFLPFTEVTG